MKLLFSLFTFILFTSFSEIPETTLNREEQKLYDQIMAYRQTKKLPSIALSTSLTFVAQTHAKDLALNNVIKGKCNAHSWSNQGDWTECCYTADHSNGECMRGKPAEMTHYKNPGYEIVTRYLTKNPSIKMTATEAVKSWKNSPAHNNVIINKGDWKGRTWNAIGIGMYNGVACIWFGLEKDTN